MRIGIAFDLLPADRGAVADGGPDDRFEEFDKPETVAAIADVIRGEGHDVVLLGDGPELLRKVLDDPPDFVFNIAEGQGVGRCREARVPAALEMLGIPYSGSDPLTLSAALDKGFARRSLEGLVDQPKGVLLEPGLGTADAAATLRATFGERFDGPVILKPNQEGSSKGIRGRCLAWSLDEAIEIHRRIRNDYDQATIAEEFIDGDEVTVGIIGNACPEIVGFMRILPKRPDGPFVYSLEVKRDWSNRVVYEAPARLEEEATRRLTVASLGVYRALGCRDLARIDFRVRDGIPYFIEVNPLPGLAPGVSDLVILAAGQGIEYDELIKRVLYVGLLRHGLAPWEAVVS